VLAEIRLHAAQTADRQLAASLEHAAALAEDPGLDVKHKLKVTIPIVPFLLEYEGEFELNSRLNLRRVWGALVSLVTRT
jgi:hypothetical protein